MDEARRHLERTKTREALLTARCREARTRLIEGEILQASDIYNQVLETAPGYPPAVKGITHVQKHLRAALRRGEFASPQHQAAAEGTLEYNSARWDNAAPLLESALGSAILAEDLTEAHVGEYAAKAKDRQKKELWRVRRAALLDDALREYRAGRLKTAQIGLKTLIEIDPSDAEAKSHWALVEKMLEEARAVAQEETRRAEIEKILAEADLWAQQSLFDDAVEALSRALELDPSHPEIRRKLDSLRETMKNEGRPLPPIAPEDDAEELYRKGLQSFGNGNREEALKTFQEVLRR
ncbi:MAG TPA: hypothetical protein P5079_10030, partial [Elusimicrobiota bacterium]|nr:hypothetical protein [Elusimicrobiota bacterium]